MDQYPQYQDQQYPQYQTYQQPDTMGEANGHAKAALILGILSLVLGNFILGIIGIVQANKAYALGMDYGKAKAGKILSIIGIIVTVILIIVYAILMASNY